MPVTKQILKNTKSLLTKKGRREKKQFLAEGVRLLEEAVRFRFWPERVFYSESMLSDRGRELLAQFTKRRIPAEHVAARDFAALCDTRTPQGLLAVFTIPLQSPPEPSPDHARTVLVCDNISDPGNLGTLMRSALAFGFRQVRLFGYCADPWSPRVVRASAGTLFGLRVQDMDDTALDRLLAHESYSLIVADTGGQPAAEVLGANWAGRNVLLAIGSEAAGVSAAIRNRATVRVRLEHDAAVESLNAAVAASILMKLFYDMNAR